jgi:UPF0271 protein
MKINCDIGERGADHPVDRALMELIDIANLACGGHAGDSASVAAFRDLAKRFSVELSVHLSYPDRENFGRKTIPMALEDLLESLNDQFDMMDDVKMVKFHGALYNDCAKDPALAVPLAAWLKSRGVNRIITQFDSELAMACRKEGITVVGEAFAERRYSLDEKSGRLSLVSRDKDYASIHELEAALAHSLEIYKDQKVSGHIDNSDGHRIEKAPLLAETICIHSDSVIALELARSLKSAFGKE